MDDDDLISRKEAIEAVKIPDGGCNNPSERHGIIFARVEAGRAIQAIPSVPAVPLDQLCEFLAENDGHPWCVFGNERQNCECNVQPFAPAKCWKHVLTKWMEGLDGNAD